MVPHTKLQGPVSRQVSPSKLSAEESPPDECLGPELSRDRALTPRGTGSVERVFFFDSLNSTWLQNLGMRFLQLPCGLCRIVADLE